MPSHSVVKTILHPFASPFVTSMACSVTFPDSDPIPHSDPFELIFSSLVQLGNQMMDFQAVT